MSSLKKCAQEVWLGHSSLLRSGFILVPLSWAIVIVYISRKFGTAYSPDSFAYYLIGNNFISGLGYVSQTIRDFYQPISLDYFQPSRSFPPVMPIVVALVGKLTGLGITSGLVANIVIMLAAFHLYFHLSKRLLEKYWLPIFLLLPFFILTNAPFVDEIVSGRSIPLAMLCILGVLYIVSADDISPRSQFLLGVILGILYLTRFDALVFCVFFIGGYLIFSRRARKGGIVLGFLLVLAPWIIRNLIEFGTPLASDNSITAISTFPNIVQICYFVDGVPTLKENLGLWMVQRAGYLIENIKISLGMLLPYGIVLPLLVSGVGLYLLRANKKLRSMIAISWVWWISNLAVISLTPYHDARYFSISTFLMAFSASLVLITFLTKYRSIREATNDRVPSAATHMTNRLSMITAILVISLLTAYAIKSRIQLGDIKSANYIQIYSNFRTVVGSNDLVAIFGGADHLAYYSSWRTIYMPLNIDKPDQAFLSFVSKFDVKYAIVSADSNFARSTLFPIKGLSGNWLLLDVHGKEHD